MPEALLEFVGVECSIRKLVLPVFLEVWVRGFESWFGVRGVGFGFFDEGRGDRELAFAEEMHGDGSVYEGGVGCEGVIFGGGDNLVFEFLWYLGVSRVLCDDG